MLFFRPPPQRIVHIPVRSPRCRHFHHPVFRIITVTLRSAPALLFHRTAKFVVTVVHTTVRHQPVERHHAVFCRGPFPRAPPQQVSRRVVLPARQIPLILRAARRDAPRGVVEVIRFPPPAVPRLQQFILAAVAVLPVRERLRYHPAHPAVCLPALQPPGGVIKLPRAQSPLTSEHLPVQGVTCELADDLPVQIYLLEMAAAVVQMTLRSAVRKGGGCPVAEFIVLMGQDALRRLLGQHPPQSVVTETDNLRCIRFPGIRPSAADFQ
ncbi:Uncharacterised protein [Escherichia coli]|nr:Uncharacterised protein [Escherichia coli]